MIPNSKITLMRDDGALVVNGLTLKDIPRQLHGAVEKLHAYEMIGKNPEDIELALDFYDQKCEEVEALNVVIDELRLKLSEISAKGGMAPGRMNPVSV